MMSKLGTEEVTAASGFKILTHRMDFFGICRACQGKGADP